MSLCKSISPQIQKAWLAEISIGFIFAEKLDALKHDYDVDAAVVFSANQYCNKY